MNYKNAFKNALSSLNVPVEWETYSGSETTYITGQLTNEQGEEWAENQEIATRYSIQVDIWSMSDTTTLEGQVKAAMIAAGFGREFSQGFYESETGVHHIAMRFVYIESI